MHDDTILAALYESVLHDDALDTVVALLAKRYVCPSGALVFVGRTSALADVATYHGSFDGSAVLRYRTHYALLDPAPAAMARLPLCQAAATDRLFDRDREHQQFLQEFYYPLGIVEAMGAPVLRENGEVGVISVLRGADRPAFDDDEIASLSHLAPHIGRTLRLRSAFFEIRTRVEDLSGAVEPTRAALMVLSPAGVLRHANAAARAILHRGDAFSLDAGGRLKAAHRGLGRALALETGRGGAAGVALTMRVPRGESDRFYAVRAWRRTEDANLVIAISDPDAAPSAVAPILKTLFGLTDGSVQIVTDLLAGLTLQEHAAMRGVSANTARFRLKVAFRATGTARQADLVRIVSNTIRDLAL